MLLVVVQVLLVTEFSGPIIGPISKDQSVQGEYALPESQ
jgi:hypothetical protein